MPQKYPSISLCMIARDEEDWIGQCLESVRGLVDEIILVDTGSVDATRTVGQSLGARIYEHAWTDDFAAARNISLGYAKGDWILVLDADEAIDAGDHQQLRELTLDRRKSYELTQRHYTNDHRLSSFIPVRGEFPHWEQGQGGYFESSLVRLFPNREGIVYKGRVHELAEHSIRELRRQQIVPSNVRIHHYGHTDRVKKKKTKAKLYTPLGQAKLTDNPKHWQNYFELGVEHNNNLRYRESAEAFMKAVELNPHYVPTWVNLGYVLCELGNYEQAVHSFQRAIQLEPGSYEAYCNMGVVFMRVRQYKKAEQCFHKAIELNETYVNAYCNLGKTLALSNRFSEAAHIYLRALEILPNCTVAKADLGAIFLGAGLYKEAETQLLAALKDDPGLARVHYYLSQVYQATNATAEAVRELERFCALEQEALDRGSGTEFSGLLPKAREDCQALKQKTA